MFEKIKKLLRQNNQVEAAGFVVSLVPCVVLTMLMAGLVNQVTVDCFGLVVLVVSIAFSVFATITRWPILLFLDGASSALFISTILIYCFKSLYIAFATHDYSMLLFAAIFAMLVLAVSVYSYLGAFNKLVARLGDDARELS